MKYKLKVYSIWEFGQRKDADGNPHQEDSLYPAFGTETETDRTFILCDGMGGHDAGEVASATVCEAMSEAICHNGHDEDGIFTKEDFSNAIAAAFDALDQKDNGAEKKMGTTMTFLKLHNKGATIAHMGDSRVYHIRPGRTGEDTRILHETEDHSLVNDLIKIGELSREEARSSKQKNVITRAMQPHMERRPKPDIYTTVDVQPGDYFYMCSDGMLEQPEMEDGSVLKRIFSAEGETDERRVEILRGATSDNRDNHTAFVIHVIEVSDVMTSKNRPTETSKQAIVEEEEEKPANRTKVYSSSRPTCSTTKLKYIIGVAVIALGLLGMGLVKSCTPSSEKEKKEEPGGKTRYQKTTDESPKKSEQEKDIENSAAGQSEGNVPATEPPRTECPTLDAALNDLSHEGVVNSTEQTVMNAVRNSK